MAFFRALIIPKILSFLRQNEIEQFCLPTRIFAVIFLFFFSSATVLSQGHLKGWAEAGSYIGNASRLPFWLRSNEFGTVPLFKPNFTGRAGAFYDSQAIQEDTSGARKKQVLRFTAGAELVYNNGPDAKKLLLPEAFAKLRWKKVEFWAGRQKEIIGIVDTTLSSGSFTWSGNALPVPKIQIGFPQYVPIKFLKNYVSVKGTFSHGWYNTPYIQGAYLHQKTIHVKLGKPGGKFSFQAGLDHHVTWGGHADYLKTSPHAVNGKLTDSFGDYLRGVVLAKVSKDYHNGRYTNFDGENRIGNHVGQFDFAVEYKLKNSTLLFYNNHPFEDASGVLFQNMPDGLYGLSWKKKSSSSAFFEIRGALAEYMTSKDQSGAGWNVVGSRFKGNDNYFNHGQYIEGWSYFGRGMGTPLIAPKSEISPDAMGVREFFPSSRVVAYHFGLEGRIANRIEWMTKVTFSTEFGTNNIVYDPPLHQFSYLLTANAPIFKNTRLVAKLAFDQGDFFVSSLAGYVGIRWSGWIR
jgi:hypothetical protein